MPRSARPDVDHYAILGVVPAAGAAEIRRAYRKLALRHHPDRAGRASTELFQRIADAYRVLSDPDARGLYDAARKEAARAAAVANLINRASGSLDALVAQGIARRTPDGALELLLDSTEARAGGTIEIKMGVTVPCPTCGGSARPKELWCRRCEYQGFVPEILALSFAVPPGIPDGSTLCVEDPGFPAPLRVRLRVGA